MKMMKMIFKKCDFLSPEITLYFKGYQNHSSIFSGILTIIAYSLVFIFAIYNIKGFINKENPTIYYYNRYVQDAGFFPLNSSSIFHYFQLINTNGRPDIRIDYDAIRIVGINRPIENYMKNNTDLTRYNHWVYGPCNYNEINDDEIRNIINKRTFPLSACIKEYYDLESKKYSKIGESGFRWPVLDHGASNPNRTLYGIIIEKCHNDSLKNDCKSDEEINDFFNRFSIMLNVIDEYADVLNYKNPYTKYIYALTSGLYTTGSISLNNLNFNPSITITHKGIFFDEIVDIKSYVYSQNEKMTLDSNGTDIVAAFYFWMQNIMIYNERSYKTIEDLLSDIGGFENIVLFIAFIINSFVKKFIILLDTEELVLNIDKINYNNNNSNILNSNILIRRPTIYRKAEDILNPPKKKSNKNKYNQNQNQNSKLPIFIIERCDNNNKGTPKSEPIKNLFLQNTKKDNNYCNRCINIEEEKKDFKFLGLYNKNNIETQKENQSQKFESCNEILMDLQKVNAKMNIFPSKGKINKPSDKSLSSLRKNNFTWFNYIYYLITFKRSNPKIKFYEDFRAQIISEENLLQNYSDIYKLLKCHNIKNHNYFEINGGNNL